MNSVFKFASRLWADNMVEDKRKKIKTINNNIEKYEDSMEQNNLELICIKEYCSHTYK